MRFLDRLQIFFRRRGPTEKLLSIRLASITGQPFGQGEQTSPRQLKNWLQQEQRQLASELEQTFLAYQRRLDSLAHRIQSLDQNGLWHELTLIQDSQHHLQTIIQRAAVADQDTRALLDEWHDWQRYHQVQDQAERQRRLELLRSELAVRGVRLDVDDQRSSFPSTPEFSTMALSSIDSTQPEASAVDASPALTVDGDELDDWDQMLAERIPLSIEHWTQEWHRQQTVADVAPETLAFIAHQLRAAHADQRLLDRRLGRRRYRLADLQRV